MIKKYTVQSAIDAQARNYGKESYWDYLEESAKESYEYYMKYGQEDLANKMLTRSLGEALQGNDGE